MSPKEEIDALKLRQKIISDNYQQHDSQELKLEVLTNEREELDKKDKQTEGLIHLTLTDKGQERLDKINMRTYLKNLDQTSTITFFLYKVKESDIQYNILNLGLKNISSIFVNDFKLLSHVQSTFNISFGSLLNDGLWSAKPHPTLIGRYYLSKKYFLENNIAKDDYLIIQRRCVKDLHHISEDVELLNIDKYDDVIKYLTGTPKED